VLKEKASILIIEDDLDVADMLQAYFKVQDYEVWVANWGEEGVNLCIEKLPQLVVLDIRLPDIDGYEVARRLRKNRRTQFIPIIFLTEKRARSDRLQGLELGADDYITKPFDVQELRLRVRNALRRAAQGALTNPVTNLPEGILVDDRLEDCLKLKDWALILVGLLNLDNFRDIYGFVASDDVLRAISLMINNTVRDNGTPDDFVGHFSPLEFIIITRKEHSAMIEDRLSARLEQSLDFFYPLKDRGKRDGTRNRLNVHIRRLDVTQGPFGSIAELKSGLFHPI
jgi:PleD family two-component response regulator